MVKSWRTVSLDVLNPIANEGEFEFEFELSWLIDSDKRILEGEEELERGGVKEQLHVIDSEVEEMTSQEKLDTPTIFNKDEEKEDKEANRLVISQTNLSSINGHCWRNIPDVPLQFKEIFTPTEHK